VRLLAPGPAGRLTPRGPEDLAPGDRQGGSYFAALTIVLIVAVTPAETSTTTM